METHEVDSQLGKRFITQSQIVAGLSGKGVVVPVTLLRAERDEHVDRVDDAGDVAEDGEQQADAELHLFKTEERPILLLVCYQDPDKAIELN